MIPALVEDEWDGMPTPAPEYTGPEHRRLDRGFDAEPCHKDGGYEVRAGDSRVDARDVFDAYLIAFAHNELRAHPEDAWRLRGAVA